MALIAYLMSELLSKIMRTGQFGALKVILLEMAKREVKETAEKPAKSFVHLRKIKRMYKFQL
ncbi:MAG: hypothetical protein EBW51_08905 [Actinobacteria bacterium]|nr:hypothetical protein [Actinomycetota bacterium]